MRANSGDVLYALYSSVRKHLLATLSPDVLAEFGARIYAEAAPDVMTESDKNLPLLIMHELGGQPQPIFGDVGCNEVVRMQLAIWVPRAIGLENPLRWRGAVWDALDDADIKVDVIGYEHKAVARRVAYACELSEDWWNLTSDYDLFVGMIEV